MGSKSQIVSPDTGSKSHNHVLITARVDAAESTTAPSVPRRLAIGVSAKSIVDHVLMPRKGLELPRQLPFDNWLHIGQQLSILKSSSAWCLGDWLTYGETAYDGRYRDAIEQTSLDYQTLRNYAWVSRSFPFARRRETLSFGHHAEVAALTEPEQEYWLRKAEQLSWSRNRLRQEVRASVRERSANTDDGQVDPDGSKRDATDSDTGRSSAGDVSHQAADAQFSLKIHLTEEQVSSCRVAAERTGLNLEDWIARVLDQAVREDRPRRPLNGA